MENGTQVEGLGARTPLPAVPARYVEDWNTWAVARVTGTWTLLPGAVPGTQDFWFICPCGCRKQGVFRVGRLFKPASSPSWHWNGSEEAPTLKPAVHDVGHWFGELRNGKWRLA